MGCRDLIILDTHIWIWWVHDSPQLPENYKLALKEHEASGLGISVISCWEAAKLVEYGRLKLPSPIDEWINAALNYPGIQLLPLTPEIAIESTRLPVPFHRDPADQIIVATSRIIQASLMTLNAKLQAYPHVDKIL